MRCSEEINGRTAVSYLTLKRMRSLGCVFHRDFGPGSGHRNRVIDGMERSRKVIFIVSR